MLECSKLSSSTTKAVKKKKGLCLQKRDKHFLSLRSLRSLSLFSWKSLIYGIFCHLIPPFISVHSLSVIFLAFLLIDFLLWVSKGKLWRSSKETESLHHISFYSLVLKDLFLECLVGPVISPRCSHFSSWSTPTFLAGVPWVDSLTMVGF